MRGITADELHEEQKAFPCSYCGARPGDYCRVAAPGNTHKKAQFAHAPRARLHWQAKYGRAA